MGVNSSKTPVAEIVLIGYGASGKTYFLDMLTFGEHTTYRPTIGTYPVLYEHDHQLVSFIEYGGSTPNLVRLWQQHHGASHGSKAASSIWVFIQPRTTNTLQLVKLYGSLMNMLALRKDRIPVCIALQGRATEADSELVSRLFQLRALDKAGWPVRMATFNYDTLAEWARVVEVALDWVIDQCRSR